MKTKKVLSLILAAMMTCTAFTSMTAFADDAAEQTPVAQTETVAAEHTYTVVGDASFLGDKWNPATAADHMDKQDDGTFVKEYTGVGAGVYELKVAEDDAWDVSFGADETGANFKFEIKEENSTVKVMLTIKGTKTVDVKDEAGNVTGTKEVTDAEATVLVNGVAPEAPTQPAETFHVVAGDAGLCNGVNWDPADEANKMTKKDDGTFEIVYTGVAKGEYNFKVTTNGGWDNGDWNLSGDAKFGGPNATIVVEEDNSTVKVTLNEADEHANCYINDKLVEVEIAEPTETKPAATVDELGNTSDTTYKEGGYYYPSTGVTTERFFFAMPTSWKTFNNAAPCAYWWNEPDACRLWQESYLLRDAGTDVTVGDQTWHVYYIDAAAGIGTIIFNNGIDGGQAPTDETPASPNWGKNYQTANLSVEGLDKGENPAFPDGLENFNNMIFIVDENDTSVAELSGATTYGGSWNYFHEDSTFDTTPGTVYEVKNEEKVAVTGVTLDKTALTLAIGGTDTLTATIAPVEASNKEITWASSNTNVATINANTGKVTAVGAGTADITVTTADGSFTATCTVTVKAAAKKTTVTLKKTKATIYVKGTVKIAATVKNGKGTTTYKSSNAKIAKVSKKGVVTGVKKGTAKITVTNNKVSKVFTVTVKNPKLNKSKVTLAKKGKTFKIKVTGLVGKAKFKTNNKKVATVSAKGVIKAVKKGSAKITVTANGVKLTVKVTVKK